MSLHRLTTLTIGVADVAANAEFYQDFDRLESALAARGAPCERRGDGLVAVDAAAGLCVAIDPTPRLPPTATMAAPVPRNPNRRSEAVDRAGPVRPAKPGHVVVGSPDAAATRRLLIDRSGSSRATRSPA